MRLGELLGLQWGDIDFQGRFIEVQRSLVEGGRIELPKNGKIRRVDLSLLLGETLEKLRVRRAEEALAKSWKQIPAWVFCNEEGRPIWKSDFERRVFHKALEKARLRRIRFHDLRHTFASRLLQNGESVVYVKDQLGHHSIKVTVDVYGHLVPGANKAAVDRLDQQALAALAALEARNPTQPPRNPGACGTDARGHGSLRNPASRIGGAEGARTPDPKTASLVLSQLSYSPTASPSLPSERSFVKIGEYLRPAQAPAACRAAFSAAS